MTTAFEPIFEARSGWLRIYLDLPGMGETPRRRLDPDDRRCAGRGRRVDRVAILSGETFALAGASYGGYLALGLMHRRAASVTGLALVAPGVEWDDEKLRKPERRIFHVDADTVASLTDEERFWTNVSVVQVPETLAAFRAGRAARDADRGP